jgi:putative hydroxymethylpyrimidine transport system permease protein
MSFTVDAGRVRPDRPVGAARVPADDVRPDAAGAGSRGLRFLAELAGVAVGLTAAWWLAVLIFAPPVFLLPGPDRVAVAFVTRFDDLMANAAITGSEIVLGLAAGSLLGIGTALAMAYWPLTRRLILPLVVVLQSLPVFAIAPVLVLWFGFGLASKIVMASLIIFFPVASAFHDGLARTDPGLLDLATLYRARRGQTLALIRIPAALPALVSGLRMAASVAPIGAVVGEWVGSSAGLGLMMMHANARLQTDTMFAALVIVAGMAVVLRLAVDALTRRLVPWLPETD